MANIRLLTPALAKKARDELNEDPSEHNFYLEKLREWLEKQTSFHSRTDEVFLLVFLRTSKFDLEKTKERIKNFYEFRSSLPEIFRNRALLEQKSAKLLKTGCVFWLPEPVAPDGPRVIFLRAGCIDWNYYSTRDLVTTCFMGADIYLRDDMQTVVAGFTVIVDLANVSTSFLKTFEASLATRVAVIFNKTIFPARFKGLFFLNTPGFLGSVLNFLKTIFHKKLRDRFYFYGKDYSDLYEHIPKRILPKPYGGNYKVSDLSGMVYQKFKVNRHIILEEETYGLIDTEPVKSSLGNDLGIAGSFKKLDFD